MQIFENCYNMRTVESKSISYLFSFDNYLHKHNIILNSINLRKQIKLKVIENNFFYFDCHTGKFPCVLKIVNNSPPPIYSKIKYKNLGS